MYNARYVHSKSCWTRSISALTGIDEDLFNTTPGLVPRTFDAPEGTEYVDIDPWLELMEDLGYDVYFHQKPPYGEEFIWLLRYNLIGKLSGHAVPVRKDGTIDDGGWGALEGLSVQEMLETEWCNIVSETHGFMTIEEREI